jgi:arylsulfatase
VLARRSLLAAPALLTAQSRSRRPNILFFFPDQWRFDWMPDVAGLDLHLPNLRLLTERGVKFTQAAVSSPLCAPSRACLASGQDYPRCGVPDNGADYPLTQRTYYQSLRERGYAVLGVGKLDLHKKTMDWGLDGTRLTKEWGFSAAIDNEGKHDAIRSGRIAPKGPYMKFLHDAGLAHAHVEDFEKRSGPPSYTNLAPTPLPDSAYCDNWIAENGFKLLRAVPQRQPWHLVLNFTGPHDPMDVTRAMLERHAGRQFPQPRATTQYDPAAHNGIRERYAAMCENIDRWLGAYIEEIRKRGELDNTLVVFSSDHGEMLGDLGLWAKSKPYDPSVRVPLVVAGPGVERKKRSGALVQVHDLAATMLDAAGAAPLPNTDGRGIQALLAGRAKTHRHKLTSGLKEWKIVSDGRWKLVEGWQGQKEQLFDTKTYPAEDVNLAAQHPEQIARLRAL